MGHRNLWVASGLTDTFPKASKDLILQNNAAILKHCATCNVLFCGASKADITVFNLACSVFNTEINNFKPAEGI